MELYGGFWNLTGYLRLAASVRASDEPGLGASAVEGRVAAGRYIFVSFLIEGGAAAVDNAHLGATRIPVV